MKTIMVHMSEPAWTMQAMHLACALARNNGARVILLQLLPVRHPSYLGTPFGTMPLHYGEYTQLEEYSATAEDYGVDMLVQPMQCATTLAAVVDAADQLEVDAVFAHIRQSWLPYWREFQVWNMRRQLAAAHRQLFTLEDAPQADEYVPTITIVSAQPATTK